jgi:hypothetical protein
MGGKETRKKLIYELIGEKLAPLKPSYASEAMERGHVVEEILKERFPNVKEVGMIKKDGCDFLGISPDGIIPDEFGRITKAIEIKAFEATNFVRTVVEREIPSEYFWQVVHYFVVIDELEELDFLVYNPEIYDPKLRLVTINVTREQLSEDIARAQAEIVKFRVEWVEAMKKVVSLSK